MAQKIINTKIREAYDTEANWIKHNPVLLAGQLAFSSDKYGKYKIGDGIAKWSQLQYMTLGWNDITGKPSSFTPSSHTHDDRYFTETEATNKFSPKEGSASLSKLASTITLGAGDAATILQNGSTYQQKIEIIDNSTSGDAVFGFYQSGDSGKNFNKLMTINDDGNVVANKFTGALAGNASSASSVPWSGVSGKPSTFPPSTHNHPASQITGLPTKLPNPYVLTVKANGYLLNTYDGTAAKEVNITPAVIGAATSGHTHSQYAPTSHNHSADNITSGVLPIGRGGTGGTNLTTTASNLQFESIGEGATTIPNNSDLNTYSTPGTYVSQSANNTGIKNRPSGAGGAFKLVVKYALGDNGYIQQIVTGYDDYYHMEYVRYYNKYTGNGTWSRWIKTFDDSDIIPVTNGGTGANTYSAALKNLVVNGAVSGSAVPTDTNWYLCSDTADSSGTPVRRPMSSLWSYIKGKTDANYLKLSGTAVSASSIKVPDTRDTNPAPNNAGFKKNAVTFDFKYASKINSPISNTYVGLMSFAPWSETSGGNGYQMAFGYINNTTPRLMLRTADLGASTWGAWYKVYTSADKPTLSELGAAAASHTHNYAGSSSAGGAANSAIKLATARTINGISFDGTKNIEIPNNYSKQLTSEDLNTLLTPGNYFAAGGNTVKNKPSSVENFGLVMYKTAAGHIAQKLHGSNNIIYYRRHDGTSFNSWSEIYSSVNKPTPSEIGAAASSHSHSNYATTTDLGLANQRIDAHEKELGVHKTLIDGKASVSHNHDTIYAKSSHYHNTINDCNSGTSIGISSTLGIVPSVSEKYDIVVTNTSEFGNKFVTMDKDSFIDKIPLKAITNSQIDSLASL